MNRRGFIQSVLIANALLISTVKSSNAICVMGVGSDCPPTDEEARLALENYLRAIFKSRSYKLIEFQKTNGQAYKPFGLDVYNYGFSALFELPQGAVPATVRQDIRDSVCSEGRFDNNRCHFVYSIFDITFSGLDLLGPADKQSQKIGAKIRLQGVLKFEKTEKGWRNNQQLSV